MANQVYANGMEVSCKAAAGKSVCAFPDVCFTPPQTPATPPGVPVPYPNTAMAADTANGSSSVKISGKEVMLKNKSYFKKSSGDEAGSAPNKGLLSHTNRGKAYFNAWSMDIMIEGENVVRHMDLITHNHASEPPQTPPWMYVDEMAIDVRRACADEIDNAEIECKGVPDPSACPDPCRKAQRCLLSPHEHASSRCCKPDTTGDHVVEANCFLEVSSRKGGLSSQTDLTAGEVASYMPLVSAPTTERPLSQFPRYRSKKAPTICASQFMGNTTHGGMQAARNHLKRAQIQGRRNLRMEAVSMDRGLGVSWWTYEEASRAGALAVHAMYPGCSERCILAQLDKYHVDEAGIGLDDHVMTDMPRDPFDRKLPSQTASERFLHSPPQDFAKDVPKDVAERLATRVQQAFFKVLLSPHGLP